MVQVLSKSDGSQLHDASYYLQDNMPQFSAAKVFSGTSKSNLVKGIFLFLLAFLLNAQMAFTVFFIILNLLFFTSISFKLIAFLAGMGKPEKADMEIEIFPIYSILMPLYKEQGMLPQLVQAIENLNYPKDKLDVKLVIEADDEITIAAINKIELPKYFEVVHTPFSVPRTKPKACNYALNFIQGEYVTIFDAEDIPHPNQIRQVLYKFENSADEVVCIQARLNYFNYSENQLTKWFALEYAVWFNVVMSGFEKLDFTIPLGGTSNHIKTKALIEAGGWDAFNVTEDADLGFRLARLGYETKAINSVTLEEAVNNLDGWFKQRTRWIKGFLQTYIVHMRTPRELIEKCGYKAFITLQLFIGAPALIFFSTPILLLMSLFFNISPSLENISIFNLCYGALLHIWFCTYVMLTSKIEGEKLFKNNLFLSCLTFPIYSFLHIYSAYRAFYQLIKAPFLWEKTTHGVSKMKYGENATNNKD